MAWEKCSGKYVSGENFRLGKWVVGGWHRDTTLPRGFAYNYAVTCSLPGMRSTLGHRHSPDSARELLETAVRQWLSGLPSDGKLESDDKTDSKA